MAIETVIIHRHINLLFFISLQGPDVVAAASSLFFLTAAKLLLSATLCLAADDVVTGDGVVDSTTKHMHADRWVFWRNISTIIYLDFLCTMRAQVGRDDGVS